MEMWTFHSDERSLPRSYTTYTIFWQYTNLLYFDLYTITRMTTASHNVHCTIVGLLKDRRLEDYFNRVF